MHTLSETELRAAKPNFHRGRLAPALESRGANLRSRKLDEKLSRDVARARRVALLAPRGVLSKYRHPLSYAGAITKYFVKFPSGGGVPEGRRGSLTPMSEVGSLFSSMSTMQPPSEHPPSRKAYSERA